MAENSAIEWCDHTFNPWIGCTRVSPGCQHCYAETLMDGRWQKVKWGPTGQRARTSLSNWKKPLKWNDTGWWECGCGWRGPFNQTIESLGAGSSIVLSCPDPECNLICKPTRQRIFCASLADVFEDNPQVANWRGELFRLIEQTPNLDWLILTKRPENISSLGTDAAGVIFDLWQATYRNVLLGISIENQETADKRIGTMIKNLYSFFISCEPILEPIDLIQAAGSQSGRFGFFCNWVICGGESGAGCRPMKENWARSLLGQCKAMDIPFFMKQLGGHPNKRHGLADFPEDLRVRKFPMRVSS